MNVVSKYVKADLSLDNQSYGYILGAFSLAYALFELPTGILGDRIGPRKVLTRVVLWWSGFTALTGTAFGFVYLLIVRFLFGMGEAGAYPNAAIVISKWFPTVEVGRAQSVIWAAGRIGGALTPLLVIPLVHAVGWRFAFGILGIVGAVWAISWYFWYRDEPSEHPNISPEELEEIATRSRNMASSHKMAFDVDVPSVFLRFLFLHQLVIYLLPRGQTHERRASQKLYFIIIFLRGYWLFGGWFYQ
jgi:MFS transporter, ACS family, glucarate transporter